MIHFNKAELRDRIYACWLGKNIGGTMAPRSRAARRFWTSRASTPRGQALPNDDLDLQLVWLKALAEVGPAAGRQGAGRYWLTYIGPPWNEYGAGRRTCAWASCRPCRGS